MEHTIPIFDDFSLSGINALPRFGEVRDAGLATDFQPVSEEIAVYVHIPYCKHICQFCMLRRGARAVGAIPDAFIKQLIAEFSFYRGKLEGRKISTIYFGGGTPSMLSPLQFETIFRAIKTNFHVSTGTEITFEGEAGSLKNLDLLNALSANDVSRISFGVQTFDQSLRDLLGRTDSIADLYTLGERLYTLKFKEINVDYIYNLPNMSLKGLEADIDQLKALNPISIDCHPLKYISCSGFMLQQIVDQNMTVPTAELRIEMFDLLRNWMFSNDFKEQFVDQYSKQELRGTSIYMQHLYGLRGGEYIGFGPGARSHYGDHGYSNVQGIDNYVKLVNEGSKPIEKIVRASLADNYVTCFPKRNLTLCHSTIGLTGSPGYFYDKLKELVALGYVTEIQAGYQLTRSGLQWYQNLQEYLLSADQHDRHQQTVRHRITKLSKFGDYFKNLNSELIYETSN